MADRDPELADDAPLRSRLWWAFWRRWRVVMGGAMTTMIAAWLTCPNETEHHAAVDAVYKPPDIFSSLWEKEVAPEDPDDREIWRKHQAWIDFYNDPDASPRRRSIRESISVSATTGITRHTVRIKVSEHGVISLGFTDPHRGLPESSRLLSIGAFGMVWVLD